MKHLIILLMLLSFTAHADDSPVYLPKSSPAPFTGYLITPDTAKKAIDNKTELDTTKKVNSMLTEEISIYDTRINAYRENNDSLAKQLASQKESGFFSKVGFFVLGAVITGGLAYGVYKTR